MVLVQASVYPQATQVESATENLGSGVGSRLPARTGDQLVSPPGLIAAVLIALALVSFAAFVLGADSHLLLVSLAMVTTATPFALTALEAPTRLIHPLTLLGLSMVLGVAGQTAYLVLFAPPSEANALLSGVGERGLNKGLLVIAAGTVSLTLGYLAVPRSSARNPGRLMSGALRTGIATPSVTRMSMVLSALVAISGVSFALYAPKVGISSPLDLLASRKRFVEVEGETAALGYYRLGISMAGIAFILSVYTIAIRRVGPASVVGILGGLALTITAVAAFSLGTRSELFVVVAIAGLTFVAVRQREPRPVHVLGGIAFALISLTLLVGFRESGQPSGESATLDGTSLSATAFSTRQWMDIGPISAVTSRVPQHYDYQYGWTLLSTLWAPVPRELWAEKPPVRIGPEISPPVFEFSYARRTGDPPGYYAELWINGGILGVLLGTVVLGAALARIERLHRLSPSTRGLSAIVYAGLAVPLALTLPRSDVTGSILSAAATLPFILIALWSARAKDSYSQGGPRHFQSASRSP